MFQRPRAGETEEDLMLQQEQLVAQGKMQPSVKLVRPDKRKTEDGSLPEPASSNAPRSKFAQDRANKKKKESIKDQTVLAESGGWILVFFSLSLSLSLFSRQNLAKGNKNGVTKIPTKLPVPKQV
ncbi:hypothetical protein E2C01_020309 [Portunus trituberculatus]|uniref:Uncharacterized protein n=1 Tax=Portunus trituberculatus TaxID=210409 RepID=A0A5B7E1X5_PORTR|nr:hypothetical protein [Portunus trituberculatus]